MKNGGQQLWKFKQILDRSMSSGLGVAIGALSPIPCSTPIVKDLKQLKQKTNNIFLDLFYGLFAYLIVH